MTQEELNEFGECIIYYQQHKKILNEIIYSRGRDVLFKIRTPKQFNRKHWVNNEEAYTFFSLMKNRFHCQRSKYLIDTYDLRICNVMVNAVPTRMWYSLRVNSYWTIGENLHVGYRINSKKTEITLIKNNVIK